MPRQALFFLAAMLAGCATTGATFGSGVGDRQLEHPPWYAGSRSAAGAPAIARFMVAWQGGASQPASFDPSDEPESPVAALLRDMNAFLDSVAGGPALPPIRGGGVVAPNVYFGCERDASEACVERGDSVLGRQGTTMRLAVERPSPGWIARNAALLDSAGASHALVITLEVGQYWTRQKGLRGDKSVELGAGHEVPLPWLTSLEMPVTVLQLTGALINREGKAVRIGAEGLLAQRSPIIASGFGAQRLISDEDVDRARTQRRTDLPGQPLVWQEALCRMIVELAAKRCA
jgi:hypothetical protein